MSPQAKSPEAEDAAPHVLELRVHGVNNTPPNDMLEVLPEDAEKVRGDSLGSFWTLTPAAVKHAQEVPDTAYDHLRAGVRREAYSWGPMARKSPSVPGLAAKGAVTAVSRAGWMLLLPLGLANVAYWSRRLSEDGGYARGARPILVFGFGLSLFLVTAVEAVSLDLVGTQCITSTPAGTSVCSALPSWLTWLSSYSWPQRLAFLSLAPFVALLFLQWLATGSRVRYEVPTSGPVAPPAPAGGSSAPPSRLLATPGLWSRWGLTQSMSYLHLAGGLALVVLTLSWSQVYGGRESCRIPSTFFTDPYCWPGFDGAIGNNPQFAVLLILAAVVLVWTTVLVAGARREKMPNGQRAWNAPAGAPGAKTPSEQRTWNGLAGALLIVAVLLFLANAAALWLDGAQVPADGELIGLRFVPAFLLTVLLLIAVAGLTWRRSVRSTWAVVVLAVIAVAALGWAETSPVAGGGLTRHNVLLGVAGVAFVGFCVLAGLRLNRDGSADTSREQAWSGRGPGVFLLLSVGTMMMLSEVSVVAVGDWLNGKDLAQCLSKAYSDTHPFGCRSGMVIPATYTEFAFASLVGLGVVAVAVAAVTAAVWVPVLMARIQKRAPQVIGEAEIGAPEARLRQAVHEAALVPQPAGTLEELAGRSDMKSAVERIRALAGMSQRGELFVGLVALAFAMAITAALVLAVVWTPPAGFVNLGLWATVLLWGVLLGRVLTSDESSPNRPVAMIWDLMCFLPRSAHPFGPPCYAERAVPEIAARMDAWLRGDGLPPSTAGSVDASGRRVVLSAHSLGAVLSVAALFARQPSGRVALLTYGSQVRPYFGRMFPELLGPAVLGTPGCGPTGMAVDPWLAEVAVEVGNAPAGAPPQSGTSPDADSLVARLGGSAGRRPAWVNLWRRTDLIGFPASSYTANEIDRGAEEIDATAFVATVATHSGYPRTSAYRRAVDEVLTRLDPKPSPPTTPPAAPSPTPSSAAAPPQAVGRTVWIWIRGRFPGS
jgi:hypothetical protein